MASAMEDFLAAEKAPMVNQIEHLYEHDLAQVMNHCCSAEPEFLAEIIKLAPRGPRPEPKALTPAKLERYDAIATITGHFLKSMNRVGRRGTVFRADRAV